MNRAEFAKAYDATVAGFSRRLPSHDQILELAHYYRRIGMKDVSIGYLALATAMCPDDSSLFVALGAVFGSHGKFQPAIACFQSALEIGGPNPKTAEMRDYSIQKLKKQGVEDDLTELRYHAAHYFVGLHGKNQTKDGSLVLWVAPFAGRANTVTSNLLNTFTGLLDADVIVVNVRGFGHELGIAPDYFLHCLAIDLRPDAIFYFNPSLTTAVTNPRLETFSWIRNLTGAALICICLDLAKPYYRNAVKVLAGECDLLVTTDQPADVELAARAQGRVMLGWHVVDKSAFTPRGQKRDLDVSFVGKFDGHYDYREPFLTHLRDNGIELFLAGSSAGRFLSNDAYADVIRRSRIALNFSGFKAVSMWDSHPLTGRFQGGNDVRHHLKARVFEIMESEALLFESENNVITEWFEPGVHYVPFSDKGDLLEKVRYYLANEEERQVIAAAGRRLALEKYNANNFWHGVFDPLYASGRFQRLPTWRDAQLE